MNEGLGIIIRSSGENTLEVLRRQLSRQKKKEDDLYVLSENVPFEVKLRRSYEVALKIGKPLTLIIDADILVIQNFLKSVKRIAPLLRETDLGFGCKLLDRFYGTVKFRGIHVYRTQFLERALEFVPESSGSLRPESYVKERMAGLDHEWRNDISERVVGLHDYFQAPKDIFYKQFIRASRSLGDVEQLQHKFRRSNDNDFFWALEGLRMGTRYSSSFTNDKTKVVMKFFEGKYKHVPAPPTPIENIQLLYLRELLTHLGVRKCFRHILTSG